MVVIGLTGPSGAGKSTLLREAERMGGLVIDCDGVYDQLLHESEEMRRAMEAQFGSLFLPDRSLDRKRLAELVFSDPEKLERLNCITHFFVGNEVKERLRRGREQGAAFAVVEAIALVESGLSDLCDSIVGILAPRSARISRIMLREHLSKERASQRIDAQKPDSYFIEHCDCILHNEGTEEDFVRQIKQLLSEWSCAMQENEEVASMSESEKTM